MDVFNNTSWWKQYMQNSLKFTCARNEPERLQLQINIFDENKVVRSFEQFLKLVKIQISSNIDETLLRTEYELARRCVILIENWNSIWADRDLYPFMVYKCSNDPCDLCKDFDGLVMPIDDLVAQDIYPPNHFNCRCSIDTTDDDTKVISGRDLEKFKIKISKQFQGNVGTNGIFNCK